MEPGGLMPHSQGLSNNSYPESNQPNSPHELEWTINKAQGQTLRVAGIDLTTQCSSHGQLYVALSCVTSK